MTEEEKQGQTSVIRLWRFSGEANYKASICSEEEKATLIKKWRSLGLVNLKSKMDDLHATFVDANEIYDFLFNVVCKDIKDITIMST